MMEDNHTPNINTTITETDNSDNMPNSNTKTYNNTHNNRDNSNTDNNNSDNNNAPSPASPHPAPPQSLLPSIPPQQTPQSDLLLLHHPQTQPTHNPSPKTNKVLIEENEMLRERTRIQSEKIIELENTLTLFKKRLDESEEMLYELQWDPSSDLFVCREKGDTKTVEELQEKKIFQLLEQMRVMENGLQKKQIQIDSLNNEIRLLKSNRTVGSNPTSPSLDGGYSPSGGPRLQSIVVGSCSSPASLSPLSPPPLTAPLLPSSSSTTTKAAPLPQAGWLSYFMGSRRDNGRKIVNI